MNHYQTLRLFVGVCLLLVACKPQHKQEANQETQALTEEELAIKEAEEIRQLHAFPSEYEESQEEEEESTAQTVRLSLAQALEKPKAAKRVRITGKHIHQLPRTITKLENLRSLKIDSTSMQQLPDYITELKHLKYLTLVDVPLSTLPESIVGLKNLEHLSLNDVPLSALPESIAKLKKLYLLQIGRTNIETLPKSIGELQDLSVIIMYDNRKFRSLPTEIERLKKLYTLHISRTQLRSFPMGIIYNNEYLGQLLLKECCLDREQIKEIKQAIKEHPKWNGTHYFNTTFWYSFNSNCEE